MVNVIAGWDGEMIAKEQELALSQLVSKELDKLTANEGHPFILLFPAEDRQGCHMLSNVPPDMIPDILDKSKAMIAGRRPTRVSTIDSEGNVVDLPTNIYDTDGTKH